MSKALRVWKFREKRVEEVEERKEGGDEEAEDNLMVTETNKPTPQPFANPIGKESDLYICIHRHPYDSEWLIDVRSIE